MTERDFTVGLVLRQTCRLIGRHRGDFAVAAGVLVFLPTLLNAAVTADAVRALATGGRVGGPVRIGAQTPNFPLLGSAGGIVIGLLSLVLFGIVIRGALGDLRGELRSLGRDVASALRLFVPNLVIGILFYVATILGYALLIVPGIMVQCMWYVSVPAYMAERPGLFAAFGRSRALTKGHRWRIFGVLLLYGLALGLISGVNLVFVRILVRNGIDSGTLWAFRIVVGALASALNLVGSAAAVTAYVELNRIEGGPASAELVEAFA